MNNQRLEEIITTELQTIEELTTILHHQQQAIIHFQDGSLLSLVEQEQQLLKKIEGLEQERINIMGDTSLPIAEPLKERMKQLASHVMTTNQQNRVLIDNALHFVRQIISAVTENYTRQLVDTKV